MYEVQWCLLGKTPESKPFWFDSYEEARQFLRREISWWSEDVALTAEDRERITEFWKEPVTSGNDVQITIGDVSFWLMKINQDIDIFQL